MSNTRFRVLVSFTLPVLIICSGFLISPSGTTSPAGGEDAVPCGRGLPAAMAEIVAEVGPDAVQETHIPHAAAAPMISAADAGEAPAPAARAPGQPASPPAVTEVQQPPAEDPVEAPSVATIDPSLAPPADLVADYWDMGHGAPRTDIDWSAVTAPDFDEYEWLRWQDTAFADMITIFYQLAAEDLEPSALPYAQDFDAQVALTSQPGLTSDERLDIIEDMEYDLDNLHDIIADSTKPEADLLWDQLVALTDKSRRQTQIKEKDIYDIATEMDHYYIYLVLAWYTTGYSSRPSNSEIVYAYSTDKLPPAQPTMLPPTAYEPGVAVEWDRNTEPDIAGYNVYVLQGGTPVLLNTGGLITRDTEYFHMTGAAGDTYQVTAVDMEGLESTPASGVAVLAPPTTYYADDSGWVDTAGFWALENYTIYGGYIIRVARNAPSTTSIDFTGRRVKVVSSTYCQSGDMRVWIDGVDRGTYSLYSADIAWGVNVVTVTGLDRGGHTLELECLETGGVPIPDPNSGGAVRNFVNVQYIEVR